MNKKQTAGMGAAAVVIASLIVSGGGQENNGKDRSAYILEQHFTRDSVEIIETGIAENYQTRIVAQRNGAYASITRESISGADRKVEAAQTRRDLFRAGKIDKGAAAVQIVEATGSEAAELRSRPQKNKQ